MRTILLALCALLSLAAAALGFVAYNGQISLGFYVLLSSGTQILLIFLCGHFLYSVWQNRS